jgi:DHA2 family multidrug resistance protein-like MFS transporter
MGAGLAVSALGFAVLAMADRLGLAGLIAGSVIYSIGLTPVVILATDHIVGSAPVERAGAASAISETGSELGGALGIALLGSLATAIYRGAMATSMPAGVPAGAMQAARGTLGGAVEAARALEGQPGAELVVVAREAFTQAFQTTALVCAGLALVAAIGTVLVLRGTGPRPEAVKAAA